MYTNIKELIALRKRPILFLFWSDKDGEIRPEDTTLLEETLQRYCKEKNIEHMEELDVILHTCGGDVNSAYIIAQLIRTYAKYVEILIPYHAYSGGTMISLCANKILMGKSSRISPIDIQIGTGRIPLINVEKYVDFINHCTNICEIEDERNRVPLITELLKVLVNNIPPLDLGEIFRLRSLSEYYAKILLLDYMFKNESERAEKTKIVIEKLSSESPTHRLDMDINIARGIDLKAEDMDSKLYKVVRQIIDKVEDMMLLGKLCPFPTRESKLRIPFFMVFDEEF